MNDLELRVFGNLGHDVENKYTPSGKLVSNFSVATNVGYGDNKHTVWVKCVAWEKLAELIEKMACKGTSIYLRGTPEIETWIGKESGEATGSFKLVVQDFRILKNGKPKEGAEETPYDGEAEE